jgi:hypothetical protein
MVAITVVLAATLYAMIMIRPPEQLHTVGFLPAQKQSTVEWRIAIAGTNPDGESVVKYKAMVLNGSVNAISSTVLGTTIPVYNAGGGRSLTVVFNDLSGDGRLGRGDYFTFTFAPSAPPLGSSYEILILWADTDDQVGSQKFSI